MDLTAIIRTHLTQGNTVALVYRTAAKAEQDMRRITQPEQSAGLPAIESINRHRVKYTNGARLVAMSHRTARQAIRGLRVSYMVLDDHAPLADKEFMQAIEPAFATTGVPPRIAVIG